MKKVSLETIAKALGVSKTLVSFVLNGKAEEMKISSKMEQLVLEKAKELNYKGNPMARALRTGKSKTLGLIVADITNPFFSKIARSVEDEAMNHGYNVFSGNSDEKSDKSIMLMNLFRDNLVDGLLICPSLGDGEYIKSLQDNGVPIVLVDRYIPGLKSNVVVTNNREGSIDLVKDLISKGKRRIAFIGYKEGLSTVDLRFSGYKQALVESGIEFDPSLVKRIPFQDIEVESMGAMEKLIQEVPDLDGVFFFNSDLAFYGAKAIKVILESSNREISIASFDAKSYMELLGLPLMYGIQPVEEFGRIATNLLIKQISSKKPLNKKVVIPVKYARFG